MPLSAILLLACAEGDEPGKAGSGPPDTGVTAMTGDTETHDTTPTDTGCSPPTDTGRDFVQVSAGSESGCARRESGRVECWGLIADYVEVPECAFIDIDVVTYDSAVGILADGSLIWLGESDDYPWLVDAPEGPFAQVWANLDYACGVRPGGDAACWGSSQREYTSDDPIVKIQRDVNDGAFDATAWLDESGYLGPSGVPEAMSQIRDFDVFGDDVCVISDGGNVACFGYYDYRREYDTDLAEWGVWFESGTDGDELTMLEADGSNVCTLDAAGWMNCFDLDPDGRVDVDLPTEPLLSISGASEGCGINLTGEIVCWSYNGNTFLPPPER